MSFKSIIVNKFKSIIVNKYAYALITAMCTSYAAVTYVYPGKPINTLNQPTSDNVSMSVSATIAQDPPLMPNMNTVPVTTSDANETASSFRFTTDAASSITVWEIFVQDDTLYNALEGQQFSISSGTTFDRGLIQTCASLDSSDSCNATRVDVGINNAELVTRAVVQVPTAIWLFGSGLIGLIGIARRKKS